jgi:recombination DNA repair RAD52 pathway protein
MQLKNAYDELYVRRTDPLSRDAEVARLLGDLQEVKQHHLNANQTALMANRVTETLRKELQMTQQRVSDLEVPPPETHNQSVEIKTLEEIVDTCRRSDELKDCSIWLCKDWVCTKRVMDLYDQQREHSTEINTLQREQAYHINTIAQLRRKAQQWQVLTGQD